MSRLTKLWVAVAACALMALLLVAADRLASLVMRVLLTQHRQWWWPHAMNALAVTTSTFTVFLLVFLGIAAHRRRARRSGRTRDPQRFGDIARMNDQP